MRILISAAEASSDAHGAALLKALRELEPGVEAFGVGGPRLREAGLKSVVDARKLLAMGFGEILSRIPTFLRALRDLDEAAGRERPDVAVVIDYPDFHFRLARKLSARGVPVVYYIPPKVWVWRKKRIQRLKASFVKVLSILPFEVPFYESEQVPVTYVGNPLVDQLPLDLSREQARDRLQIPRGARVAVLMAGSRPAEIQRHLEMMLDAAVRTAARVRASGALGATERLVVLVPFPVTSDLGQARARVESWLKRSGGGAILDVRVSQGDAAECLVAADAGLIKSGTSTLEAAMLGCPHAIVYRTSFLTAWLYKLIVRYTGPVGLSNLVAGWERGKPLLVREILLFDVTTEALSDELLRLLTDTRRREELALGLARVRERVIGSSGKSPSATAAQEILGVARS